MRYPLLEVDLSAIAQNARVICGIYRPLGISVAGVVKGGGGRPEIAKAYLDGGCAQLASSRVGHLAELKKVFPDVPTMLLRIPMLCEAEDAVRYADYSLNSELRTMQALNDAAGVFDKVHKVILMLDVGDRREGYVSVEELAEAARTVKDTMPHLQVAGVGTNYGCVSGVLSNEENLEFLCEGAKAVEGVLGHPLEIVSGGSSSSLIRWSKGLSLPSKINHLRIGGYILNPVNMRINRGVEIAAMNEDTFCLKAQVIEVKEKNGAAGTGKNWKGETVRFEDNGVHRRAIIAAGSQDVGDPFNLLPKEDGVIVIASSSDHTVLDVTDCAREVNVGDVLEFRLRYGGLLQILSTRNVEIRYE